MQPLRDYGTFLFDSCSDAYRARQFTINTETQCLKVPLAEYNVSIPAATILGYVSTLDDETNNQASLLRGMHVPAVTMTLPNDHQNGVVGLLASSQRVAKAVLNFLQSVQWNFVSVVVSSSDHKSMVNYEAFMSLADEYDICVGNVLFYSPLNRTRLNSHQSLTNVTIFFTTSLDAAEFTSTRLRFNNVELTNNVDVMVNDAQDFIVHDPNLLQYSGTVAIRPKDIISNDFKEYLKNVTPLSLPEQWFWNYIENQWRLVFNQNNAFFIRTLILFKNLIIFSNLNLLNF